MIKVVLFDYGGVLTEAGGKNSIPETAAKLFGVDIGWDNLDEVHDKLRKGRISTDEFFIQLAKLHGSDRKVSEAEWHEADKALFNRSEPVYKLAEQLRDNGIQTAILSNIYEMSANMIRQAGNYDGFEPLILSYEVHLAKPDPEIFRLAEKQLKVEPQEILFIDDQQKSITPTKKMGWHTILATSPAQIVADVKRILKNENGLQLNYADRD